MTEDSNIGTRGDAYLSKLNSEGIPAWAKGLSFILTGLIGFILALGLNVGEVVNTYMSSRNLLETTALSQGGTVEVNALTGLIQVNSGMTSHITGLISSINSLIEENSELTRTNSMFGKENATLQLENDKYKEEIRRLTKELQDLVATKEAVK